MKELFDKGRSDKGSGISRGVAYNAARAEQGWRRCFVYDGLWRAAGCLCKEGGLAAV
jgi:hypothetical protein